MIYSLNGKLIHNEPGVAVIECGGIGFRCAVSFNTQRSLPRIGDNCMLYTYLNVREDALDLYGFATKDELGCYKLLTGITGVGPKVALAILSELTSDQISLAVASGDSRAFTKASGVGAKLASRITLELKDKVKNLVTGSTGEASQPDLNNAGSSAAKAVQALGALGYSPSEAALAVGRTDTTMKTEDIIREALKLLASNI
jgi:Holliday junction DNA helicase RuvA